MLPLKRRLEALGLILFVDVDGRLDGNPTFPEALDQGVRAAKAVLGCWSPWALTRPWVQTECAMAKDENKLVAVERAPLTIQDVPALLYLVDRKPLVDFIEDQPHEGWAMTLAALATKMRLWAEKRAGQPETADALAKADLLDKAATAERAALGISLGPALAGALKSGTQTTSQSPSAQAWAAIGASLEKDHYRRFERTFETDPTAFQWVIEAEARAKALERWEATDKHDPDAIAAIIRSGLFPALEFAAKEAMQSAAQAQQLAPEAKTREAAAERAREVAEAQTQQKREAGAGTVITLAELAARSSVYVALAEGRDLESIRAEFEPMLGKAKFDAEVLMFRDNRFIRTAEAAEAGRTKWTDAKRIIEAVRAREAAKRIIWAVRASEAAKAGRPVAERAFPIELPGVTGWPTAQMIAIPPGKFVMGAPASEASSGDAERPQHEVRIDNAFALGQHTVTFAEWDAAIAAGAKLEKPGDKGRGRGNRPVISVNWEDAQAYLAWLNDKTGLTGRPDAYRLPSEAEWEYACRAGTTTPFSFGATISTAQAQFSEHGFGSATQTLPVGLFPANAFGLYDMHGNVWEWCEDNWHESCYGAPSDGSAWTAGGDQGRRALRGGSWYDCPPDLRCAARIGRTPGYRNATFGFRLARTVLPPES